MLCCFVSRKRLIKTDCLWLNLCRSSTVAADAAGFIMTMRGRVQEQALLVQLSESKKQAFRRRIYSIFVAVSPDRSANFHVATSLAEWVKPPDGVKRAKRRNVQTGRTIQSKVKSDWKAERAACRERSIHSLSRKMKPGVISSALDIEESEWIRLRRECRTDAQQTSRHSEKWMRGGEMMRLSCTEIYGQVKNSQDRCRKVNSEAQPW